MFMVILKKESESVILKANNHNIILSNPNKVYWKEEDYTKSDLIQYYHMMAPYILPYLKNRPMVMRRNPDGIDHPSFFQKDTSKLNLPSWIKTIKIQHDTGLTQYLIVQDEACLLYVVNLGCIELNPFNSRVKYLDRPDYLVFDLDPEDISMSKVVETAHVLHEILEKAKIANYCKTSGGRGLHIYVPLNAKYTFEQVRRFAEIIAIAAHQQIPEFTSLERMPAKRQKKVYIDTLQNDFSKTLAAAYCIRPKPHAPVSTPLKWSEVKPNLDPSVFNIISLPKRIKLVGDIFSPVLGPGVDLQHSLKKLEKLIS